MTLSLSLSLRLTAGGGPGPGLVPSRCCALAAASASLSGSAHKAGDSELRVGARSGPRQCQRILSRVTRVMAPRTPSPIQDGPDGPVAPAGRPGPESSGGPSQRPKADSAGCSGHWHDASWWRSQLRDRLPAEPPTRSPGPGPLPRRPQCLPLSGQRPLADASAASPPPCQCGGNLGQKLEVL